MQMSVRPGGLWNPGTQSAKTTWPGGGGRSSVVEVVGVVDVLAGTTAAVVVARGGAFGELDVLLVQAVTTIASISSRSCRVMTDWTTAGALPVPRSSSSCALLRILGLVDQRAQPEAEPLEPGVDGGNLVDSTWYATGRSTCGHTLQPTPTAPGGYVAIMQHDTTIAAGASVNFRVGYRLL
jgi:hypothetical protein